MVRERHDRAYRSADDVGDLHVVIINHIGEVIGGKPITLQDDEIILWVLVSEAPVNDVLDYQRLLAALEADGVRLAAVGTIIRLLKGNVTACAGIKGGLARLMGCLFEFLQGVGVAKASVCFAFPY